MIHVGVEMDQQDSSVHNSYAFRMSQDPLVAWLIINLILKYLPFLCHQHVEVLKESLLIGTFLVCLKMMTSV